MNYKLAISKIPKECKDMLDSLGIDPLRIFGVETFQEAGESFIEYHCHTLLVGKISPATISDDKYITYQTNAFHLMAKREHSSYMNEVENIPGRSFTLIFVITLPWILQ